MAAPIEIRRFLLDFANLTEKTAEKRRGGKSFEEFAYETYGETFEELQELCR
jgi:hypothetical protein